MLRILFESAFRWFYWYPLRLVIQRLPIGASYLPACKIGALYCLMMRDKRQKIIQGMQRSFQSKDREELDGIAKRTFIQKMLSSVETFYYPMLSPKNIGDIVRYEGLENLDNALAMGKGAILCHAHFGNEELLMPAMGYKGYKVNQIASRWEPEKIKGVLGYFPNYINRKAFEKRIGYRETFPVVFHYVDKSLRSIYRSLENNEVFLIAADGREGSKWTKISFLGREALFTPGVFQIAKKTSSPILPVFLVRQADFTHKLIIEKPLQIGDDIEENMKRFFARLESYVSNYPCQYAKVYWLEPPIFVN